jgi:hypothetical protein
MCTSTSPDCADDDDPSSVVMVVCASPDWLSMTFVLFK